MNPHRNSTHESQNGSLPKGWRMVRFDELAQIVNERVDPSNTDADIYVGLEHLDSESLKIRRWGTPSDVIGDKLQFRKGDIIFGRRRAYQRKLAVAEFDGICSAHAMVLRAKTETVNPEFLPFLMQSDLFMQRAIDISVGSLSPTINWKTLRIQEFPLPPKDEQRRIAEILWAADECIEAAKNTLRNTEVFCDLAIAQVLEHGFAGDEKGNTDLPKHWKTGTLGSQCELKNGHGFSASEWSQSGLPIIRIQNLNGSREFNYFDGNAEAKWIVEPGELLFAWAGVKGVSFGPCVWDGPRGVLNQHIYRIIPNVNVEKKWLYEVLRHITQRIEKKAHGFKLELVHARKAEITDQVIPIPSKDDQLRIARLADTCRRAIRAWQSRVLEHGLLKKELAGSLIWSDCNVH